MSAIFRGTFPKPILMAQSVLPGRPRLAGIVKFERAVVDFFLNAADSLGVPKSVAAIYGIVFASPVPLSFAEIGSRLDISRGSVSQGLRVLREVQALKEVSNVSARAESFTPDLEMRKLVGGFLDKRLKRQLDEGTARLAALQRILTGDRSTGSEILRERLRSLKGWHCKARALLPLAKTSLLLL